VLNCGAFPDGHSSTLHLQVACATRDRLPEHSDSLGRRRDGDSVCADGIRSSPVGWSAPAARYQPRAYSLDRGDRPGSLVGAAVCHLGPTHPGRGDSRPPPHRNRPARDPSHGRSGSPVSRPPDGGNIRIGRPTRCKEHGHGEGLRCRSGFSWPRTT